MERVLDPPDVLAPATLGPVRLRNRVIKAATYEGLSHRSLVTTDLVEFHRSYAAGGVGMTTVAYCAVAPEGRTDRHQLQWTDEALPGMRRLTEAVHDEGAAVSAQIGHAGPVADGRGNRMPVLAPGRRFPTMSGGISRRASHADLERITRAHAEAAGRAIEAGFDAVEVHLGHHYLASAFLSPKLNRRKDEYGGNLQNRSRLARGIMRAVRDAVDDRIAVLAKLNLEDGVHGGTTLEESTQVAQWIEQDGTADALEMTAGSSLLNPMYLFRGGAPVREFAAVMAPPMNLGLRLFGRGFLREYPYRDLFLLDDAREVRRAVTLPMVLLGGVTDRAGMDTAMREGFQYVAMARALLREPDLVNRIATDARTPSLCIHCNRCMPTNFIGTYCPEIQEHTSRGPAWGTAAGYA